MKTIIVATDFSPASLQAANYAADMALAINADLLLFHVCDIPTNYTEIPYPASDIIPGIIKNAETEIEKLENQLLLRTSCKVKISSEVKIGLVIAELAEACERVHPYSVVIGMHGAGAVERFLFGSNTLSAIRNLAWPLIIVPPDASFKAIKKIGLACDFKKVIDTTPVKEIKTLVQDLHAELHVLHVREANERSHAAEIAEESGWLQELLDELKPVYHILENENVEEGIFRFVDNNQVDLLIVIPKKHSLAERLFVKGHTRELALHTHMPVMAVHE